MRYSWRVTYAAVLATRESMMNEPMPHPLDDDAEYQFSQDVEVSQNPVYQPLLKWSFRIAAVSFAIVFLASVAANNANPNSTAEILGRTLSRIGAAVLLAACCGMLLAYRLPHLIRAPIELPAARRGFAWLTSGFATLVYCNLAGLVIIWGCLFALGNFLGNGITFVLALLGVVYAGLMATMVLWHQNYLRAYAVGALTVILLIFNTGGMQILFFMPTMRGNWQVQWPLGIAFSMAALNGLVCAGYVQILTIFRSRSAQQWRPVENEPKTRT